MKLLNRLKINTTVLFKYFISIGGSLTAFATLILSFASWEDLGIKTVSCKLLVLIGIGVASFLIAAVTILVRNKKTIFGEIDKGLSIQYGDVIDLGFNNHGKSKKIIVIPFMRMTIISKSFITATIKRKPQVLKHLKTVQPCFHPVHQSETTSLWGCRFAFIRLQQDLLFALHFARIRAIIRLSNHGGIPPCQI